MAILASSISLSLGQAAPGYGLAVLNQGQEIMGDTAEITLVDTGSTSWIRDMPGAPAKAGEQDAPLPMFAPACGASV